jgi:hypothetical protein
MLDLDEKSFVRLTLISQYYKTFFDPQMLDLDEKSFMRLRPGRPVSGRPAPVGCSRRSPGSSATEVRTVASVCRLKSSVTKFSRRQRGALRH